MTLRQVWPVVRDDVDPWTLYDVDRSPPDGRPYVVVNMVSSVDGATMVSGATAPLSSDADQEIFRLLRASADIILVGAQTVRAENYGVPQISDRGRQRRRARNQAAAPRVAVVSRSLDFDWQAPLFRDPARRPLLLVPTGAPRAQSSAAGAVADLLVAGESRVDVAAALTALRQEGAAVVLCEGGPTLNSYLAQAHLIDELCLTLSPVLAGEDSARLLGAARLGGLAGLELVHVLEEEGFVFLRYLCRQWPAEGESVAASVEQVQPTSSAALDEIAAGVEYPMLVVTAEVDGDRQGCLVGFASQCSIDPLRYMVWISKKNRTASVVQRAHHVTVHFLSSGNMDLAELFGEHSGDDIDKFERCRWHAGPDGALVLDDCARWFVGKVVDRSDTGDHIAVLVEPLTGQAADWPGQLGFQMTHHLRAAHDA
jgi:riboflavin biosynthesis pyrimidine reductase/flavin reductase (DIM6/NTAB) family NADH-FMN oxidoreductase RutF